MSSSSPGFAIVLTCLFCWPLAGWADQPIFDEMPRWSHGWGFQVVQEYRMERDLLEDGEVIGEGLGEESHIVHLQGVYTWKKWIRATVKLPYVIHAEQEIISAGGTTSTETDRGFGDAVIALPLKSYFNLDGRSGSWTLAPQVAVPLRSPDGYSFYPHEWGSALTAGYETETYRFHVGGSLSGWLYPGDKPSEVIAALSVGVNLSGFGSAGHLKAKSRLTTAIDGTLRWSVGPTLYWRINDTVHTQFQWKHDVVDRPQKRDHGNGEQVTAGIGFVF